MRIKENDAGEIVVEPVPTLREFRGAATTDSRGTKILKILKDERVRDADRARRLERD